MAAQLKIKLEKPNVEKRKKKIFICQAVTYIWDKKKKPSKPRKPDTKRKKITKKGIPSIMA
jgi:hypothetical protein